MPKSEKPQSTAGRLIDGPGTPPSFGRSKTRKKALIWWRLINRPDEAVEALGDLDDADLENLATREVFQLARTLQNQPPELLPSITSSASKYAMNAQLVTRIATDKSPTGHGVINCVREFKLCG